MPRVPFGQGSHSSCRGISRELRARREVRSRAVAYLSNQLLVPPQRAVVAMDRSRTVVRLQIHERHVSSVPCMEEVRLPSQTVNVPIGQVTHTPSTSVLPAVQY